MKLKLCLAALCLCASVHFVPAQKAAHTAKNPLEGLWALKGERIDGRVSPRVMNLSSFKLIAADKSFINFTVSPADAKITAKGRVEILSDTVFVEHVEQALNGTLNGKANELRYELENGNILYVKFFIEKNTLGANAQYVV